MMNCEVTIKTKDLTVDCLRPISKYLHIDWDEYSFTNLISSSFNRHLLKTTKYKAKKLSPRQYEQDTLAFWKWLYTVIPTKPVIRSNH